MGRITSLLIAFFVLVIAGSFGVVLHVRLGTTIPVASIAAITTAIAIGMVHMVAARGRDRRRVGGEIRDLLHSDSRLGKAMEEIRQRFDDIAEMEKRLEAHEANLELRVSNLVDHHVVKSVDGLIDMRIDEVKNTLVSDMQMIETLVKQLAEGVKSGGPAAPPGKPVLNGASTPDIDTPLSHLDDADVLDMVRKSIADNKFDLYLQPMVTLPQRKVKYYEALSRLRSDDGELILPSDYIRVAEPAGIMPMIDNLLLYRSVQVVRQLTRRNRNVGVFCNISALSLVDAEFFPQFVDFMEHNRSLAGSMFFELAQSVVGGLGPVEVESMSALADHGFRFSMDHVTVLDFDPRDLAERGFKFVKVPAEMLLSSSEDTGAQIHPADLSDLLARNGITLVAEKIETEATVVNLLDYDVTLGQGFLFSEPKPVRGETFQDAAPPEPVSKAV